MPLIDSPHGPAQLPAAEAGAPRPASPREWDTIGVPYSYLFPELADSDAASMPGGFTEAAYVTSLDFLARRIALLQGPAGDQDSTIPAAYTYLGQFIDHDVTAPIMRSVAGGVTDVIPPADNLDELTRVPREATTAGVLANIRNQHERPLFLDSLYGEGPTSDDPGIASLYAPGDPVFLLGTTAAWSEERFRRLFTPDKIPFHATGAADLPRANGLALIADRRNDENLIVSQTHLAFTLFHNKVVAALKPAIVDRDALFVAARRLVTRHYHWIVAHDYLPRILAPGTIEMVQAMRAAGKGLVTRADRVPMEFSVAAFRFGHTMIRDAYDYNSNFGDAGRLMSAASLGDLFSFTSRGGLGDTDQLPDHWVIDWQRLLEIVPGKNRAAGRLDTNIAAGMKQLPGLAEAADRSITRRNIRRGFVRRVPSGQKLAEALGLAPMSPGDLARFIAKTDIAVLDEGVASGRFATVSPAWFYFLCEAELAGGNHLGPVASRIIAETLLGLIDLQLTADPDPAAAAWTPTASPLRNEGDAPITDLAGLFRFAGVFGSPA